MTRTALAVCLVAMEALVLGGWLRWLAAAGAPGHRPPGTGLVVCIAVTGVMLGRVLQGRMGLAATRWVAVGGGALVAVVGSKVTLAPGTGWAPSAWAAPLVAAATEPDVAVSLAIIVTSALVAWRRGLMLGAAATLAATGLVARALALLASLAVLVRLTYPVDLATSVAGAELTGLAALALARLERAGWRAANPAWAGLVPAAIAAILAIATLATAVPSRDAAGALMRALTPLPEVITRIVLLGVLVFVEGILSALRPLRLRLAEGLAAWARQLRLAQPALDSASSPVAPGAGLPEWLPLTLRGSLLVVVALVVGLWLTRAVRRYTSGPEAPDRGERHVELSRQAISGEIGAALRRLRAGLDGVLSPFRDASGGGVRAWYRRFLRVMADLGQPRPVASTPLEYAPAAARVAQDGRDDVFLLTDVYNEVRYSAGVSATSAAAARAAWQRLRDRLEHVAAGR